MKKNIKVEKVNFRLRIKSVGLWRFIFYFEICFFRAFLRFLRLMVFWVPFPVSTANAQVNAVASPQAMGMNGNIYPPEN